LRQSPLKRQLNFGLSLNLSGLSGSIERVCGQTGPETENTAALSQHLCCENRPTNRDKSRL
jgi:hypothetical protein